MTKRTQVQKTAGIGAAWSTGGVRLHMPRLSLVALAILSIGFSLAQGVATQIAKQDLKDFEGLYEYRDGAKLHIIPSGERLMAIIGEGKYPLRKAGIDAFENSGGDRISFPRENGRVVALTEHGVRFARLSPKVPEEVRQLLEPRPRGADGQPTRYRYTKPERLADGIRTGSATADLLAADVAETAVNGVLNGSYPDVRSILVFRKGTLVLEEYFYGYHRERPHQMRSLTKSVIALLAGAAVARGLLRDDEPVLARLGYPDFGNPDPRKSRVTLRHLLSNQSGFACNDHDSASVGNESKLYESADWAKAFVDLPMVAEPGTAGLYCSGGIITAGRIIERASGKPLAEFAQEVLFAPLGIRRAAWRWNFVLNRSQRDEYGQIYLKPRDMLKLGILIQQRGDWNGRRVLPAAWIDAAVSRQSRVDDSDYGLGIWHRWYRVKTQAGERRVDTVMLSGNGGQKVFLVPAHELIVVFTGGSFNADSPVNEIMAGVLLPSLASK